MRLDLRDSPLDVLLIAGAFDDRSVLLLDAHALGPAEHLKGHILELDAEVLGDHRPRSQDGDVLEHRLAAVAETRRLDSRERRERLPLDVFGDNEHWLASLDDGFENRKQRLQRGELLLVEEDAGVLKLDHPLLGIGDEIRRPGGPRKTEDRRISLHRTLLGPARRRAR